MSRVPKGSVAVTRRPGAGKRGTPLVEFDRGRERVLGVGRPLHLAGQLLEAVDRDRSAAVAAVAEADQ